MGRVKKCLRSALGFNATDGLRIEYWAAANSCMKILLRLINKNS